MTPVEGNLLFPVFLKLNQLSILLVGGGNVALEKLVAILDNSPEVTIKIVAEKISPAVSSYVKKYPKIVLYERLFQTTDLDNVHLAVVASNNPDLNILIREESSKRHLLVNMADKPSLCDFYLGSIVKKGNLKLGISTNGMSPTIAKRIKELLNDSLPEEIEETLLYMNQLRDLLQGDFKDKVKKLNALTASLIDQKNTDESIN